MKKDYFQCEGPSGKIGFAIDGGTFLIRETGKGEFCIPSNTLTRIKYRNHPWIFKDRGECFQLSLTWMNNGRKRNKDILLFHDRQANSDLILFLKSRYPDLCFIGPNEWERGQLMSRSGKNIYRLYALGLATTLGIICAVLIIQIIFLYLSLSTSQFVSVSNTDAFSHIGKILLIVTLIPLGILIMIFCKKLMVVKTDRTGLTVQKLFMRKRFTWDELDPGGVRNERSNVYTGLYCYNSDQANILATSNLVEVPIWKNGGRAVVLKMPADEAGRLYRELYYRGTVSLEEAEGVKAFL